MNSIRIIAIAVSFTFSMAFAGTLPRYCIEEIIAVSKGDNFDAQEFIKELLQAKLQAKLQAQLQKQFGSNSSVDYFSSLYDNQKTSMGMSIGCLKQFPESFGEVQSLLQSLSLELGKDFLANKLNEQGGYANNQGGYANNYTGDSYNKTQGPYRDGVTANGILRLGYSMQSVGPYDWGLLGLGASIAYQYRLGSVFAMGQEFGFMYRQNFSMKAVDSLGKSVDITQSEFAVNLIPLFIKFYLTESFYIGISAQMDYIGSPEICYDSECVDMDSKEDLSSSRFFDVGMPITVGFMITPNFGIDFRYVHYFLVDYYFSPSFARKYPGFEFEDEPARSMSLGLTYFF